MGYLLGHFFSRSGPSSHFFSSTASTSCIMYWCYRLVGVGCPCSKQQAGPSNNIAAVPVNNSMVQWPPKYSPDPDSCTTYLPDTRFLPFYCCRYNDRNRRPISTTLFISSWNGNWLASLFTPFLWLCGARAVFLVSVSSNFVELSINGL